MVDHNEAMRLADALDKMRGPHLGDGINPGVHAYELAALLRQQAERIAELELQPAFAQLASDLAEKLAATEAERDQLRIDLDDELCNREVLDTMLTQCIAERDQLRAEVERLRADGERWRVANLTAETAWKHPDHRSPEENTAFSAYRCAAEDGLNFEGAVDAAVAAIDAARTTHKETE